MGALLSLVTTGVSVSAGELEPGQDTVRYLDIEVSNVMFSSKRNSGKVVYATPGELIKGQADCAFYRPKLCEEYFQVIVGLNGIGAQDGICEGSFTLIAPQEAGIYEVRFRYAHAYDLEEAIENWWEVDKAPPSQATIGLVIVSEDPANDLCKINDTNWKDWLTEQYGNKELVTDGIETLPILTTDMVQGADFWDLSQSTGDWVIDNHALSNNGTFRYNEHNQIVSRQAFEQFHLTVKEEYRHTKTLESDWWNYSRGFGILYYVSDDRNVEFRYFADIGQLSLYVRDHEKVVEHIQSHFFPPRQRLIHEISVVEGAIHWKVNGKTIFEEKTTLEEGRLMLTNHNNAVIFTFLKSAQES